MTICLSNNLRPFLSIVPITDEARSAEISPDLEALIIPPEEEVEPELLSEARSLLVEQKDLNPGELVDDRERTPKISDGSNSGGREIPSWAQLNGEKKITNNYDYIELAHYQLHFQIC